VAFPAMDLSLGRTGPFEAVNPSPQLRRHLSLPSVRLSCTARWARMRGRMGQADRIKSVWLTAFAIMGRHPLATFVPAAVFSAVGEAPAYLIKDRPLLDQVLALVTALFGYYLYLAYAEGLVRKYRQGARHLGVRDVLDDLIDAAPFAPSVLLAASITVFSTTLATLLFVVPGLWLYTRWSLATPAIRDDGSGPIAALRRSNQIVRGHSWFVFATATVAYYMEEIVVHEGAQVAWWITGSVEWGEWVGGSIVATLVTPLVAFVTSLAYSTITRWA
jgi:hypothetical protein